VNKTIDPYPVFYSTGWCRGSSRFVPANGC